MSSSDVYFQELKQGRPLEHIFNNSFFYKHNFYVNEKVLIPRSETEILVEDAVNFIRKSHKNDLRIFEIGVGPGTIALSVAMEIQNKNLTIVASDIDADALEVAKINHFRFSSLIGPNVDFEFLLADRMQHVVGVFDFILSNPPYIPRSKNVHSNVKKYEPDVALFIDDEKYEAWFTELFRQVSQALVSGGHFLMEGHEDELMAQKILAEKYFNNVMIKKDYTDRARFLYAQK